ncbi:MAG: transporter [Hyphomonadaceae bacterium]
MLRIGMKRTTTRRASALAACALAACVLGWNADAHAQTASPADLSRVLALIEQQEDRLDAQERQLREQQSQIEEQRVLIDRQRREIAAMTGVVSDEELGEVRGAGALSNALPFAALGVEQPIALNRRSPARAFVADDEQGGGAAPVQVAQAGAPGGPVGEAPPEQAPATVEALPEGSTALMGSGRLVLETSFDYSRSSSNRLVFRGVEIVTGIQVGLIEANDAARDTISGAVTARYAVTDRLEIEGRVPYVHRSDRVTTLSQNDEAMTRTYELDGSNVGDVEVSARYQLNNGASGLPIFVAGARLKSDTGRGPFDLARDADGVATELATGSGFWGLQGSVSMLYPTDPAVLFANVSYLHNFARDIDRNVGAVNVGEVSPGGSIGLSFGFGFALNPRFSYSLGYSHSYVMPTETELNGTLQRSTELQVGTLGLGMSFRATENLTLSTSVDVGVTEDAPDVRVGIRLPYRF